MSSVRVNLLPREAEERERGRRAVAGLVLVGLVVVAILVGLFFLQTSRVSDAENRLAEAEAERDRLQVEVRELERYADLQRRRDASLEVLTLAMGTEASVAGILQDVAAVMPNDAALTTLAVTIASGATPPEGFDFGGPSFGQVAGSGETLRGHAPGVERFIVEFDKIAAFFHVFVTSSTVDEGGISTFSFNADLGPEVFTARYLDGLPEALR